MVDEVPHGGSGDAWLNVWHMVGHDRGGSTE